MGSAPDEKCSRILKAESFSQMSRDELSAHRQQVIEYAPAAVIEAICESTTSLTYAGYQQQLERASRESLEAVGPGYDPAELYFFLKCGEGQVNLSPLAYHAFNLNRDENGFIGGMTLAIVWMSVGYLDIKDPDHDRSFMDAVNRILAYARKNESHTEIEMYEDLLQQIEGFKEDYAVSVDDCHSVERFGSE